MKIRPFAEAELEERRANLSHDCGDGCYSNGTDGAHNLMRRFLATIDTLRSGERLLTKITVTLNELVCRNLHASLEAFLRNRGLGLSLNGDAEFTLTEQEAEAFGFVTKVDA